MHLHWCTILALCFVCMYINVILVGQNLGGTEGYPISNFKNSKTMTWNAWHAFMTPAGFCLDLSGSLWVLKSAGKPQEGIYMLNTGRAHWAEFTQGGRRPSKVMSLVKRNLLRGRWSRLHPVTVSQCHSMRQPVVFNCVDSEDIYSSFYTLDLTVIGTKNR